MAKPENYIVILKGRGGTRLWPKSRIKTPKQFLNLINNKRVEEDLKQYPDYHFNTIFSDPPYNLGTEWIIDSSGEVIPKGHKHEFMGKAWGVDWELFFEESFRVLKYGGYCILFCIDRQTLPLEYYAAKAGLETCQHLYWYNIQGFPKSLDMSKAIDKRLYFSASPSIIFC